MYNWFQNLKNKKHRRWFHFRGALGSSWDKQWLRYEICQGLAVKAQLEDDEGHVQIILGTLLASLYLTFPRLNTPKWLKDRRYGFYIFDWTFVFFWGGFINENRAKDPWYYNYHMNLKDAILGERVHFERSGMESYEPFAFEFRGKRYVMDKIEIKLGHWFRTRIPMALYCEKAMMMSLECKNPPLRAGKGESDWDCGDDGSYGLHMRYDGPELNWNNRDAVFAHCLLRYCEHAAKDIKKYGRASGDTEAVDAFGFKYLGPVGPTYPTSSSDAGQTV